MRDKNAIELPRSGHIHFIGIGGSSMSGLARILHNRGYRVTGSDMKKSEATESLEKLGIDIHIGHSGNNIQNPDLVVYTVAVKPDNEELVKARSLGIQVIDRATLLGWIMKEYQYNIAISGTHGKTTTTSMVTMIMTEAGLDPTVHIGGELASIGGNTRSGAGKYFITEACEYYESFLKFHPFVAVILNVELDHVDYFKSFDQYKNAFSKFASLVPADGYVVACADDANAVEAAVKSGRNTITFGLTSGDADWTAWDIDFDDFGRASFTAVKNGTEMGRISLGVPGIHNVSNSLAAIAACYAMGVEIEAIREGLYKFTGTHRRFETKGYADSIKVVDDYAHHPSEVKATLNAAKSHGCTKLWCVFQPHTYTRTRSLLEDFAVSFGDADEVIITDIYAARERDPGDIHARQLADRIVEKGHKKAIYISSFDEIVDYLLERVSPGDLIITAGAGDIYKVGEMFLKRKKGEEIKSPA